MELSIADMDEELLKYISKVPRFRSFLYFYIGTLSSTLASAPRDVKYFQYKGLMEPCLKTIRDMERFKYDDMFEFIDTLKNCLLKLDVTYGKFSSAQISEDDFLEIYYLIRNFCGKYLPLKFQKFMEAYNSLPQSNLPINIKENVFEALNNFYYHSYRSSIIIARRALEIMLNDKGIDMQNRNGGYRSIKSMLDEAKEKEIITKKEYFNATKIREFGGWGAHFKTEYEFSEIVKKDAAEILDEIFTMLGSVYDDEAQ